MTLTVTEKVIFNSKIITRFKIAVRKADDNIWIEAWVAFYGRNEKSFFLLLLLFNLLALDEDTIPNSFRDFRKLAEMWS